MKEAHSWFNDILKKYKRIAIAGVPKAGKTTLSKLVHDRPVIHTDDHMDKLWADAPTAINEAVSEHDSWVCEGIQVGRCLRKGLKPDVVIWMEHPRIALKPNQKSMAKGCKTIFNDWQAAKPSNIFVVAVLPEQ